MSQKPKEDLAHARSGPDRLDADLRRLFCRAAVLAVADPPPAADLAEAAAQFAAAGMDALQGIHKGLERGELEPRAATAAAYDVFSMARLVLGRLRSRPATIPDAQAPLRDLLRALRPPPRTRTGKYVFSVDWFGRAVPDWERWLADLRGRPLLQLLEIGSFEGRSALWLAENIATHSTARITCVDTFARTSRQFDENVAASGLAGRIVKMPGLSAAVLATLPPESFDFVYVDADHRSMEVLKDAMAAWPLVKTGGLLLFDDYEFPDAWLAPEYRDHPALSLIQTRRGIDAFLTLMAGHYAVEGRGYQLLLRKAHRTVLDEGI